MEASQISFEFKTKQGVDCHCLKSNKFYLFIVFASYSIVENAPGGKEFLLGFVFQAVVDIPVNMPPKVTFANQWIRFRH